ncbi:(d)CMP kinase [Dialister micraerophilus]|uniref:Cytidylate kinase n=1 Tax=Dialister micraerophilus DSM 19965 TaxID=888062 RepID=F2BW14_9FIRM|nr:(d)CMP kinase [Dialister micraerophilus]EGF15690.1 cytidylate kinase [Dialister micraerophilus DSM 19965]MDK8285106.1 (d)CMP kinase [Dialister micraerophilus]
MRKKIIALDGPAGAGKSSVSKMVAKRLNCTYLDTGAMYRAITYEALKRNISEEKEIVQMVENLNMDICAKEDTMHVFIDGEDITQYLRTSEVSSNVSRVSAFQGVRNAMVKLQRKVAEKGNAVLDGRDIGTVVLPDADLKIFLTASVHTRALRRYKELKDTDTTLERIEEEIKRRDNLDMTRKISPLRKADDAILLDNSDLTLEETADKIISYWKKVSE